jgi:hypothetical protein
MFRFLAPLLLVSACSGSGVGLGPCDDMCRELVQTCGYAAFPDLQSCLDGCSYNESQGADIPNQAQCVADAACDTFLIVECEHAYGLDQ